MTPVRGRRRGPGERGRGAPGGTGGHEPGYDRLRLLTVAGVVVVHAAGTYAADVGWYLTRPTGSAALRVAVSVPADLGLFFGLAPLFLLAGRLSARSLRQHGPATFLRRRLARLGLPLLAYVVLVGPATTALAALDGHPWEVDRLGDGLRRAWAAPDLGPLWFVAVLLVGTVAYAGLRRVRPVPAGPVRRARATVRHLVGAAGLVAAADVLVWWRWSYARPAAAGLDLAHWPQGLGLFALGVLAEERGWGGPDDEGLRRSAGRIALVVLGLLLVVAAVVLLTVPDPERLAGGLHPVTLVLAVGDGLVAVGTGWWVVETARRWAAPLGPRLSGAAAGTFGAYVLHPPVLVGLALLVAPLGWPTLVDLAVLALAGVVVSLALGVLVHRLLARALLGRRPGRATGPPVRSS